MKPTYFLKFTATALALGVALAAQATTTLKAQVNGMVCAFCAQGIEKNLRALPQTQDVLVDLRNKVVALELKEGQTLAADALKARITEAGYTVTAIETVSQTVRALKTEIKAKKVQPSVAPAKAKE